MEKLFEKLWKLLKWLNRTQYNRDFLTLCLIVWVAPPIAEPMYVRNQALYSPTLYCVYIASASVLHILSGLFYYNANNLVQFNANYTPTEASVSLFSCFAIVCPDTLLLWLIMTTPSFYQKSSWIKLHVRCITLHLTKSREQSPQLWSVGHTNDPAWLKCNSLPHKMGNLWSRKNFYIFYVCIPSEMLHQRNNVISEEGPIK